MNRGKRQGFSLVELMVVVAIIGILASIGIQKWREYRSQARDTMRKAALTQLFKALEMYHVDHESYPSTGGNAWWSYASEYEGKDISGANGYIPNLAPKYISELPVDPVGLENSCARCGYLYMSDGVGYKLLSHKNWEDRNATDGGPENIPAAGEPFHDPKRTAWAFMLCEGATACAW